MATNNPPDVTIGLSRADAEMMLEHCDSNIRIALSCMQTVPRDTAEKLVALMKKYKRIRQALIDEGVKYDED